MQEFPGTSEIEPNEIYSVPLTVGTHSCALLVNLPTPQADPHNPPLLFCDPVIPRHSMIDSEGQVKLETGMGCDGDLVSIIRRIIQCAGSNVNTANSLNRAASPDLSSGSSVNLSNGSQLDVSLINSISDDQVANLLSDEEKFGKFITNFQSILNDQGTFIDEMKGESAEKARANIVLKREIDDLAGRLDELSRKYSQACQSYQNFMALNSASLASLNPENILTQIQVNLMELDDSTNNSIKSALNADDYSNLDLELKECIKMRKEYHKRSILLRKYQE